MTRRRAAAVWLVVFGASCTADAPGVPQGALGAAASDDGEGEPASDGARDASSDTGLDPDRDRNGHGATGTGGTDSGTGSDADSGSPSAPEPDVPPPFADVTEAAGLLVTSGGPFGPPQCLVDDISTEGITGDYCVPERFLGAAAVGDYDGDGWVDLYITRRGGPDRLLHNEGDGTFVDVAGAAGLVSNATAGAAAWADVDNDGDLDLVLTTVGSDRNLLMINDGYGHFTEQGETRGIAVATGDVHVGMGIGVGDFDLDGWIDLFVADWRPFAKAGPADHNRLLRGVGATAPGSFHDISATVPLDLPRLASVVDAKPGAYGFAPAFADLDDDGWPELTLTADFGTSRLLWNDAGRFADATWPSGVGTERNGMGSTFGDFDRDGDIDWFVSAIWTDDFPWLGHRLYENAGDRTFIDVAPDFGLHDQGWGWGASWWDYDLDGDLDLAMAAGWPALGYDGDALRIWENTGASPWPERAAELGVDVVGDGRGLVPLDYDNDGDLDLLVVHNVDAPRLFRNDVASGDWLVVRAAGTVSNRQAIGARVSVWRSDDEPPHVAFVRADTQLMGQPAAEARFGLGSAADEPVRVEVHFPASGIVQQYSAVDRNQVLFVEE